MRKSVKPLKGSVLIKRMRKDGSVWVGYVRPEKVRDEDVIVQFEVNGKKVKFGCDCSKCS